MTKRDDALAALHAAEDKDVAELAKAARKISDDLIALSAETKAGERRLQQARASARVVAEQLETKLGGD